MNPDERTEVIYALTRLAVMFKFDEKLVNWSIEEGLEQCKSKETAFRENDLYAVIMREYLRYKGGSLMKSLIGNVIRDVAENKELFDITRTAAVDDKSKKRYSSDEEVRRVQENAKKIRRATAKICDIVSNSFEEFLRILGPVCAVMKQKIAVYHNGDRKLLQNSIVAIVFLRYICLAITRALEWGILPSTMKTNKLTSKKIVYPQHVFRNLNFITKLLQKIANNELFEEWEDFSIFNKRIPELSEKLQHFMNEMINADDTWPESTHVVDEKEKKRDLKMVLDFIAKSSSSRRDEFDQSIIFVAKKLQKRTPPSTPPYDHMTVFGTFSTMNTFFVNKEALRKFISGTGVNRRRLMKKITSKKSKHRVYDVPMIEKEDYDGDEYFKYDVQATYHNIAGGKKFVVIVAFRGAWCPYCKVNLQKWNEQYSQIVADGGILIGISSQHMEFSQRTAAAWQIDFPLLGDPENILFRDYGLVISKNSDAGNGYFPYGMGQPGVIVLDDAGQQLYYWRSEPSDQNTDGATDRPEPVITVKEIMSTMFALKRTDSELSLDTSFDGMSDTESWDEDSHLTEDNSEDEDLLAVDNIIKRGLEDEKFAERVLRGWAPEPRYRRLFHRLRKEHRDKRMKKKKSKKSKKSSKK